MIVPDVPVRVLSFWQRNHWPAQGYAGGASALVPRMLLTEAWLCRPELYEALYNFVLANTFATPGGLTGPELRCG